MNYSLESELSTREGMLKCDAIVKQLLSHKSILSRILKGSMLEFKDMELAEIEASIEKPIVGEKRVCSFDGEKIEGRTNESKIYGEGECYFDLVFNCFVKCDVTREESKKLIVNLEAQCQNPTKYEVATRGMFYTARLISSQCGVEFSRMEYGKIKKVVSIWICFNPPTEERYTIERFRTVRTVDVKNGNGYADEKTSDYYDKNEVIKINMGLDSSETDDELLQFLADLFSNMESSEKIKLLNEKYGLFGKEIEEEVDEMCDYGEYMYGRGMKAGEKRGISIGEARGITIGEARGEENMVFNMLRKKLISVDVAARELNVTESEIRRRLNA